MSMPVPRPQFTVEEYLERDRRSEERTMYLDGEIYLMAGESLEHGIISANLVGILFAQLRGRPCAVVTKDTRVRSGPVSRPGRNKKGLYSYPDLIVVCGDPEYADMKKDVLLNPKVVIEVLSPSTEAFDRGEKFARFRDWNPSLSDYLLVSQDQPRVDHFIRHEQGTWELADYFGLQATVPIKSIRCKLPLVDVYDRMKFVGEEAPLP